MKYLVKMTGKHVSEMKVVYSIEEAKSMLLIAYSRADDLDEGEEWLEEGANGVLKTYTRYGESVAVPEDVDVSAVMSAEIEIKGEWHKMLLP